MPLRLAAAGGTGAAGPDEPADLCSAAPSVLLPGAAKAPSAAFDAGAAVADVVVDVDDEGSTSFRGGEAAAFDVRLDAFRVSDRSDDNFAGED